MTVKVPKKKRPLFRSLAARRRPGTGEILIWGIPIELKKRFKRKCLDNETSMTQAFIKFMEGELK
jgi:hypothetical protein